MQLGPRDAGAGAEAAGQVAFGQETDKPKSFFWTVASASPYRRRQRPVCFCRGVPTTQRLLTAEELGELLQVRPSTVMTWAREGLIPRLKISGNIIRFDYAAVLEKLSNAPPADFLGCPADD